MSNVEAKKRASELNREPRCNSAKISAEKRRLYIANSDAIKIASAASVNNIYGIRGGGGGERERRTCVCAPLRRSASASTVHKGAR